MESEKQPAITTECTEAPAAAAAGIANSNGITLVAKFGKTQIVLENLNVSTTVAQVKELLSERTRVLPKRQKLIGLSAASGGKMNDDTILSNLKTTKRKSSGHLNFILMGTPEEEILVDRAEDDLPDVIDDFDLDFNAGSTGWLNHVANEGNLKKFTDQTSVFIMNEPRGNKPLMVLDLDHTLLDFSSKTLQRDSDRRVGNGAAEAMKRPHMDSFLTTAYLHYDLVVWSQTSWRWLETKLTELGMLTNPGYKFCFVLDKTSMFAITSTKRDGSAYKHQVKPLQLIWSKYPRWGAHNTCHLDDLSRNFALNLTCGLKVTAYYRKRTAGRRDAELLGLGGYLERLAQSGMPFDKVDFNRWVEVVSGKMALEAVDEPEMKK
mmetsp:Transcript_27164/g.45312  ORF Transcript_27164/g.45312 Transcript_27164/m.45312 type:complete len:378 (-) Transcript_27164:92-1225(-)|eukprot:CAMPEP_0119031230 /NCGR_PEP_ID=MMETSP1176-20130426/41436_1 /TAXON_ID=265551 /ORGANISM="Synedropsis recta cf, Strain CCMP1620" /LENGTH=377 /DNA_ID=CAMNT_0006987621 /DNA_START=21 /DNA_END=1154 /DNA_ORIENTATION=+